MLFFNKTLFKILIPLVVFMLFQGMLAGPLHAARSVSAASGTVVVSALNMRSCPDTSCSITRILTRGDVVRITGTEGTWLAISHGSSSGYIYDSSAYIQKAGAVAPGLEEALEEAREIEKRIVHKREDVSKMDRRAASTVKALDEIEKRMASVGRNLEQVGRDVAEVEKRMARTSADIAKTVDAIAEIKLFAEKRLVALYKLNRIGGMNLLATAGSTSDLFRRMAAIETIVAHDEKNIKTLVDQQQRLAELHAQAVADKARQAALEHEYNLTRQKLANQKKERESLLADIRSDKSKALSEIEYLRKAAQRMDDTIAGLKQWTPEEKPGEQKVFSEYQGLLKMPVNGKIISQYGKYREPNSGATAFKNGIEIKADRGAPVHAVFAGETSFSDWLPGFGRVVVVSHGNSFYTVYGHLEELFAREGEEVRAGEVIATVGDSGSPSGTILYFEVRHRGNPLDPLDWIEKS